ncbi:MAG: FtsX-like permease family protein, partial [Acidobacteriota bacterium]
FSAAGIPLLEGRPFRSEDRADSPPVAIVSRQLAERYWPGASAVGQRLTLGLGDSERTIVGVVGDVAQARLDEAIEPQIYRPLAQLPQGYMEILLRTEGSAWSLVQPLREAVLELDSNQIPYGFETLENRYRGAMAQQRLFLFGLGLFAIVALTLAALGMFSIMAYHVHRRQHEIGLRMAVGAQRDDVVRLILRRGMTLFAIGGGLGLILASSLGRLTESLLYEISVSDPWTMVGVGGLTATVALLACVVPALRAASLDPIDALRGD